MTKYVDVVTHIEMGWDCVCGVFETREGALRHIFQDDNEGQTEIELQDRYDNSEQDCYIIHSKRLES